MSEPTPNPDAGQDTGDSDGSTDIKALREAAKKAKATEAENEQLQRQLAFAKAGVDVDSKIGSMLFKTYEGDLSNVDALKAEWQELNPTVQPAAEPETAPAPEGFQSPEGQQAHREQVQGEAAGEQPKTTPHPIDHALEAFHGNKQQPLQTRQETALAEVFSAYFQGDQRVMLDRQAHQQAAQQAAAGDMFDT